MDPGGARRLKPAGAAALVAAACFLPVAGPARDHLSAADVKAKREGPGLSGLPLVNFATDTGFGYGARVYLHLNGNRADPDFARTPWRTQVLAQYFRTTAGWEYDMLDADLPELPGRDWRLRLRAAFEGNTNRNWFGEGAASRAPLPAPDYGAYLARLEAATPAGAGSTGGWFHAYELRRPFARAQVERWFGEELRLMAGMELQRAIIRTWDGRRVRVEAGDRIQGPTLVGLVRPRGIEGGNLHHVRLGAGWDTRDYEPAPKRGTALEAVGEYAGPATGADWTFTRGTICARSFVEAGSGVIIATRGVWSVTGGRPPFFDLGTLSLMEGRTESLGGGWTLRGYRENRFTGMVVSLANLELRWNAHEWIAGSHRFLLTPVAFADGGRTYDHPTQFALTGWNGAAGGGVRIAWNRATILNATWGRSGEDTNIFIDFGHPF